MDSGFRIELKTEIVKKFSEIYGRPGREFLGVDFKSDRSVVTALDIFISNLVKEKLLSSDQYRHHVFFSEEDNKSLNFPCAILDPIDGTASLLTQAQECCVSLALAPSAVGLNGEAWIFNPFTGFEIHTQSIFSPPSFQNYSQLLGLVSRSEHRKGLFDDTLGKQDLVIAPKNSIALKLGHLAAGACDFVITRRPKNVWDVAAGTILCAQRGIHAYTLQGKLTNLNFESITGPVLWCNELIYPRLKYLLGLQS